MSGENETASAPIESTPAPAPETAAPSPAAAAPESAAPALDDAETFLPDAAESKAEPSTEGKADDGKTEAKPEGEADDFLAETDDDDAAEKSDAPGDENAESAAEAYQPFELPEGTTLAEAALAEATAVFRKQGRSQEEAQELVSLHAKLAADAVQAHHQALAEGHAQNLKDWAAQTKAHPEFGGKNLTASKAQAAQALALEPSARKVLVEYGLDRHPAIFALLARVGSKLSPDSLVRDDAGAPEKAPPKRAADVMYS